MPRLLPVPTVELSLDDCRAFVELLRREGVSIHGLAHLQDYAAYRQYSALCAPLMHAVEASAKEALDDPTLAIFTLDIPEGIDSDPNKDSILAAIIAVTIMGQVFDPAVDSACNTPFTLHKSSPGKERCLMKAGLHYFSSGEKVGFHTDGSVDGETVRIPELIGLYNLRINYQKPGNLYWVPFPLWEQMDEFAERFGWAVPYRIELAPAIYSKADMLHSQSPQCVYAPVFSRPDDHDTAVLFNGKITGRQPFNGEEIELVVAEMGQSISLNPVRYCIPQRQRRLVIARNDRGFHARDKLEKPYEGCKYTRSFIRAVSECGPLVTA